MIRRKLIASLVMSLIMASSITPYVFADEVEEPLEADPVVEESVEETDIPEDDTEAEESETAEEEIVIEEDVITDDVQYDETETAQIEEEEPVAEETEEEEPVAEDMVFEDLSSFEDVDVEVEEDTVVIDSEFDNDQLAEMYIMQEMDPGFPVYYSYDYESGLNDIEACVYSGMYTEICSVASGDRADTQIRVSTGTSFVFTPEDVGLEEFAADDATKAAIKSFISSSVSSRSVILALMGTCPYEMYWFDKTTGVKPSYGYKLSVEEQTFTITSYTLKFAVAQDYQDTEAENPLYTVDTTYGQAAAAAAANAIAIVDEYAALPDYDKLSAYMDKICELVDYDYEAIADDAPYGNPWQLVWVFDGNSETKVVCEGYSKAFQFLCDNSVFSSSSVYCLSVSGLAKLGGSSYAAHMWNIVCMENGNTYVVDVTSSDNNSLNILLLGGKEISAKQGETTLHGFEIYNGYKYLYTTDMWNYYDTSVIMINTSNYVPHIDGLTGWKKIGNTWYYYIDGNVKTGWYKVKSKWYYFNSIGEMQTGWVKVSGKWYFLNANGDMKTGWYKEKNKWYYLQSSGAMAVGWLKIGKEWYYFNSNGTMRVGWLKYNNKWYCLHSDGHMLVGRWKINGKYYTFDKNGVCLNP